MTNTSTSMTPSMAAPTVTRRAGRVLTDRLPLTREIKTIHRDVKETAADLGDSTHAPRLRPHRRPGISNGPSRNTRGSPTGKPLPGNQYL